MRPRLTLPLAGDPAGRVGLAIVMAFLCLALFGAWLTPYDPFAIDVPARFQPPGLSHPLGTDNLGRDLFSRVVLGAGLAFRVSVLTVSVAMVIGVALGLLAGYGPRWLDFALMLVVDAVYAVPTIVLGLTAVALLGASETTLIAVIVLILVPTYARLTRTMTLSLKSSDFVQAVESTGASGARVLALHLLPNVIGPVLVVASMDVPAIVALEAGLTFLGMGTPPPAPSWGRILQEGFAQVSTAPWILFSGALPLVVVTLGFTLLGESLRDRFDPKHREAR